TKTKLRLRHRALYSNCFLGSVPIPIPIPIRKMGPVNVVGIHVESVQDKALSLPDRYSPKMFARTFPFRNIRAHYVACFEAHESFIVSPMANRKPVFCLWHSIAPPELIQSQPAPRRRHAEPLFSYCFPLLFVLGMSGLE